MLLSSDIYNDDIDNAARNLPLAPEKISDVSHQSYTVLLLPPCPPTEVNVGGQKSVTLLWMKAKTFNRR